MHIGLYVVSHLDLLLESIKCVEVKSYVESVGPVVGDPIPKISDKIPVPSPTPRDSVPITYY